MDALDYQIGQVFKLADGRLAILVPHEPNPDLVEAIDLLRECAQFEDATEMPDVSVAYRHVERRTKLLKRHPAPKG